METLAIFLTCIIYLCILAAMGLLILRLSKQVTEKATAEVSDKIAETERKIDLLTVRVELLEEASNQKE